MNLLKELNELQKKAVAADGVVIITAGPGSGKTKTLTSKIAYLVQEKKVNPEQIIALTFTQKATAEMKERLSFLEKQPQISTFHAFALSLIANTKTIISEKKRNEILQALIAQHQKTATAKETKDLGLFITNYKNSFAEKPNELVKEYDALLLEQDMIDYDDVLINLYNNLQKNSQTQFQYILVDEFQDTNLLQYNILQLLNTTNNIFVIGDPQQSIYSFRGANPEIFETFKTDFPQHTHIVLSTNYRSEKHIVEASNKLFPHTQLVPFLQTQGEIILLQTFNEYTEADWIVNRINEKIGGTDLIQAGNVQTDNKKIKFNDFAVIYRTHALAKQVEQRLYTSGIPYQVIGGDSLFESVEIQFIVLLLQYLFYKKSEYIYELLLNPVLHLSKKSKFKLHTLFHTNKKYAQEELEQNISVYGETKKDTTQIFTFFEQVNNLILEAKNMASTAVIHKIAQTKLIEDYLLSKKLNHNSIHTLIS
ncbi:MAG TPA: ATP-dependent helicase, partial [Candidatus Woesebacteria bacterium]|nr:ATP-dependent helicase [Candidatus Woesebacteria bacterium]